MVVKYSLLMRMRNYQRFKGNNRFYCCGRLMSARQAGILIFVVVTIIVMSCLYFPFEGWGYEWDISGVLLPNYLLGIFLVIARFLILNVHPIGVGVIFPLVAFLGLFYSLAFLLRTGCTDPGIVPRAKPDEIEYMQSLGDVDPNNTAKGYAGNPARYMTVMVKGQQIKLKWCPTCNIWRPPRASHCGLCNNCYENFDHHCPWVGNCVAKRNYRFFYLFLCSIFVMAIFVMGCNIAVIVIASKQRGFFNALKDNVASVIEFCIAGLAAISVAGLAFMHTWLIATMQTTNEDIKGTFKPERDGIENPYKQRNCCTNFLMIVCGPTHPSLINRRGLVDESMMLEEEAIEGNGYGATTSSNIPKLPPETDVSTPLSSPVAATQLVSGGVPASPDTQDAAARREIQVEIHERQESVAEDTQRLLGNS